MNKSELQHFMDITPLNHTITIKYSNGTIKIDKAYIRYDIDIKNQLLKIERNNGNERWIISTKAITSIKSELTKNKKLLKFYENKLSVEPIAKVGEI